MSDRGDPPAAVPAAEYDPATTAAQENPPQRRTVRLVLLALAVAIALPAAVAVVGAVTAEPAPEAFRVFGNDPTSADTTGVAAAWQPLLSDPRRLSEGPSTLERDADVSLIAYVAREPGPEGDESVCIAAFRIGQELLSACAPRQEFLASGVRAEAEQPSSVLRIEWMPDGRHSLRFDSEGPTSLAAVESLASEPLTAIVRAGPSREQTARAGGVIAGPLLIGENRTWALESEIRRPYDGRGQLLVCVRSTYVSNPEIAQSGTCAPVNDFLAEGLSGAATLGTFWTPWSLKPDGTLLLGDG